MTIPVSTYVADYLEALPLALRGSPADSRYQAAATVAHRAGWPPADLAAAVEARVTASFGVRNPPALAVTVMAEVALAGPPTPDVSVLDPAQAWRADLPAVCLHARGMAMGLAPNQCGECRHEAGGPFWPNAARPPKVTKDCPTCHRPLTECDRDALPHRPAEAIAERVALLADLAATTGLTEDERESRMVALIRSQEGRLYGGGA